MTLYFRKKIFFLWSIFICLCISTLSYADNTVSPAVETVTLPQTSPFKPYNVAFTQPDMKPYDIYCANPKEKRQDYLDILRRRAGLGDTLSTFKYGAIVTFSPCEGKSIARGKPYLTRAGQMKNKNALYLLGLLYNKDSDKTSKDTAKSYFKQAADLGHGESAYNYGISLGDTTELAEKIKYLSKATEQNIISAKHDYVVAMASDPNLSKMPAEDMKNQIFLLEKQLNDVYTITDIMPLRATAAYNLGLLKTHFKVLEASHKDTEYLMEFAKKNNVSPSVTPPVPETQKPTQSYDKIPETITMDTNSLSQTTLSEYETWRDKNALNPTSIY